MNNLEFAKIAKDIAQSRKTLYIVGCFGAPLNEKNKQRYSNNYEFNKRPTRTAKIMDASNDTFGFDCVCLVKGILWGWNGDANKTYGGAVYRSNSVPDFGADGILNYTNNLSTDFNNITIGEILHMPGHVGVYIGDGLAVECTPIWKDGVQITAVGNMGKKSGYNTRTWVRHGKLDFVTYEERELKKTNHELAKEVLEGKWGNGIDRKNKLIAAGYNYEEVQSIVNELVNNSNILPKPDLLLLVKRTIRGDFGSGQKRKMALKDNYEEVQRQVNLNLKNGLRNWNNIKLF